MGGICIKHALAGNKPFTAKRAVGVRLLAEEKSAVLNSDSHAESFTSSSIDNGFHRGNAIMF